MKQRSVLLLATIAAALLLFTMCEKDPPKASFSHSSDSYEQGDTINFKNKSKDADAYEWDFGDGSTISTDKNPWHIYYAAGNYIVNLTAENEYGTDEDNQSITVKDPTILGFYVTQDTTEIPVADCAVVIYESQSDWENGINEAGADLTDNDGLVVFYHAKAIVYYIYVLKQEPGGAWFLTGYTSPVVLNEINLYNVPAQWIPNKKASAEKIRESRLLRRVEGSKF